MPGQTNDNQHRVCQPCIVYVVAFEQEPIHILLQNIKDTEQQPPLLLTDPHGLKQHLMHVCSTNKSQHTDKYQPRGTPLNVCLTLHKDQKSSTPLSPCSAAPACSRHEQKWCCMQQHQDMQDGFDQLSVNITVLPAVRVTCTVALIYACAELGCTC